MSYEYKQDDVYALANKLGIDIREKGKEIIFKRCPYCNGGNSGKDKETFSVNSESGAFNCFRSSCSKSGHFVELARDFNFILEDFKNKAYRPLPQKKIEIRNEAVEYMKSRGISEAITKAYNITTMTKKRNVIVFPFYDENNIMQFVKYRNTKFDKNIHKNKEWCEKDTKPILFGMAQCENFDRLIITEGQIDSLSVAEAGIRNAVSVPTGANGFTWLQHCYDWVSRFNEIIIFGDWENGKMSLLDTIRLRFPKKIIKSVQPQYYLGEKDANDILRKYGTEAVRKAVENAIVEPVKYVKQLADVEAVDIYNQPSIKTFIPEIDRKTGGLIYGQVILLSGRRGEGKSTFMSQIIANALDQGDKVFAYSGELTAFHFKRWLDLQIAGCENIEVGQNQFGDETYKISDANIEKINNWYRDRAFIYDNTAISDEKEETTGILEVVEQVICRYGVTLVCIDNLMTAMDVALNSDLYHQQSDFVKKLCLIAKKYNVVIILVAHPKKFSGDFDNDSVSGSADITNRVDVVINFQRADSNSNYDSTLTITKNRLTGELILKDRAVELKFSKISKRVVSANDKTNRQYKLWEESESKVMEEAPF